MNILQNQNYLKRFFPSTHGAVVDFTSFCMKVITYLYISYMPQTSQGLELSHLLDVACTHYHACTHYPDYRTLASIANSTAESKIEPGKFCHLSIRMDSLIFTHKTNIAILVTICFIQPNTASFSARKILPGPS